MDEAKSQSRTADKATNDLIYELKKSGAPRFLLSLFQVPDGQHIIKIDNENMEPDDKTGHIEVWHEGDVRNAALVYANTYQTAAARAQGLEPVYSFYEVKGGELGVSHGTNQSEPDTHQYLIALADLANETSIEDFCDLHSLTMNPEKREAEAPLPITETQEG